MKTSFEPVKTSTALRSEGTFTHWVMYNIPATETQLAEGLPPSDTLPSGAKQGMNDFKRAGYGGPCPPPGNAHHYLFKVYALDAAPNLMAGASKKDLLKAMNKHPCARRADGDLRAKWREAVAQLFGPL